MVDLPLDEKKRPDKTEGTGKFVLKEFFDRLGFGFSSQQFINIFFLQTGASYFLIGLITGIKNLLSVLTSSLLHDYSKKPESAKKLVIVFGIMVALVFIALAYARFFFSLIFFSILLILSGIFIPLYGDIYSNTFKKDLNLKGTFIRRLSQYGLIVTGISLLITGFILDKFKDISLNIGNFKVYGYAVILGIASVSFLISTLLLATFRKSEREVFEESRIIEQFRIYMIRIKESLSLFHENKMLIVLLLVSIVLLFVQTLGNAYYGVFIFEKLGQSYMNVSIVFVLAVLASIVGPYLSHKNAMEYGKFPMLVFGTLLMAIMPLTFYYNPNIVSISMGVIIGTIGAAINGTAHGLLTLDFIPETKRQSYFSTIGFIVTIPSLILIILGSYIAEIYGLKKLFLLLGLSLAVIVVPVYLIIVLLTHKKKL